MHCLSLVLSSLFAARRDRLRIGLGASLTAAAAAGSRRGRRPAARAAGRWRQRQPDCAFTRATRSTTAAAWPRWRTRSADRRRSRFPDADVLHRGRRTAAVLSADAGLLRSGCASTSATSWPHRPCRTSRPRSRSRRRQPSAIARSPTVPTSISCAPAGAASTPVSPARPVGDLHPDPARRQCAGRGAAHADPAAVQLTQVPALLQTMFGPQAVPTAFCVLLLQTIVPVLQLVIPV